MKKVNLKIAVLSAVILLICLLSFIFSDSFKETPLVGYKGVMEDAPLSVHGVDVSQGAASLIKTKSQNVLIDTGERCNGRDLLNYLKGEDVKKLDLLFITHPHSDHYGSVIDLVDEIDVRKVILPSVPSNLQADDILWQCMLSKLYDKGIEVSFAKEKEEYYLGNKVKMELLGPFIEKAKNLNETSLCFKITLDNTSFLITGDGEKQVEKALLKENISVDVLFAGHHGSKTSSNEEFLKKAAPKCSLISVGRDNPHGLPDRVVLDRLSKYGEIFRTDLDGSVVFLSDGENIKVIKEK